MIQYSYYFSLQYCFVIRLLVLILIVIGTEMTAMILNDIQVQAGIPNEK